jgi:hypothetical protein
MATKRHKKSQKQGEDPGTDDLRASLWPFPSASSGAFVKPLSFQLVKPYRRSDQSKIQNPKSKIHGPKTPDPRPLLPPSLLTTRYSLLATSRHHLLVPGAAGREALPVLGSAATPAGPRCRMRPTPASPFRTRPDGSDPREGLRASLFLAHPPLPAPAAPRSRLRFARILCYR